MRVRFSPYLMCRIEILTTKDTKFGQRSCRNFFLIFPSCSSCLRGDSRICASHV